jgi:MoaA/NifB/PqqE/SkfB family radical SAM enzyme
MKWRLRDIIEEARRGHFRAWGNACLNYVEGAFRVMNPRSYPIMLDIVLTKKCNLRCLFCISYDSLSGRDAGEMDFRLYEHLARTLFPWVHSVYFCSGGEPLLYPRIRDALRLAQRYGTFMTVVSNGMLLDQATAQWLVADQSLHDLVISFDGARPETLERIRRGADFATILANLRALTACKRAAGEKFPRLSLQYTIMRTNAEELPEIVPLGAKHGVSRVRVNYLNVCNQMDFSESLFNHPELAARVFQEARRQAQKTGVTLELPPLPTQDRHLRRCFYPWQFSQIDPDGAIRFCYHAWRQRLGFAGAGFDAVWRGAYYRRLRRTLDSPAPFYPFCHYCPERLGYHQESAHNHSLHTDAYLIPGLEHLQTIFTRR